MMLVLMSFVNLVASNCIEPSINILEQDDPTLVQYVRDKLLERPPMFPNSIEEMDLTIEYTSTYDNTSLQGQYGQAPFLEKLFKPLMDVENTTKRFFIEAGSYDGIFGSNTLRLELNPLWSGLLVEPNQELYKLTKERDRNCWTLPSCFSTKTKPETVKFDAAGQIGGIINEHNERLPGQAYPGEDRKTVTLQCIPLYSILLALGMYVNCI